MRRQLLTKKALSAVLYLIIGVLSVYIVFEVFMPKQTIKVFGFKPYLVITDSMEPMIMEKDLIIVKEADYENLLPKDIITFQVDLDGDGILEIVTHFIDSVKYIDGERIYQTHGDNHPTDDWVLTDSDILGVYQFKLPFVGKTASFLRSPLGILLIVGYGLYIVFSISKLLKNQEKEKKENS